MPDIVKQLRNMAEFGSWQLLFDAAREIETLRDEAERLRLRIANDEIRMRDAAGETTNT